MEIALEQSEPYDASGQRAVKTGASGAVTHYVRGDYQVEDVTGTPVETVTYFFGGVAVATDRDGNVEFLHVDHLGSPVATTNSYGTVVGTQAFFPFGEVRTSTGSFDTQRGFTGQIADVGTGLNFYNARYQDPALGRFISPDSIVPDPFNPTDRNRFVYVMNNPLKYTDPTGHCILWVPCPPTSEKGRSRCCRSKG